MINDRCRFACAFSGVLTPVLAYSRISDLSPHQVTRIYIYICTHHNNIKCYAYNTKLRPLCSARKSRSAQTAYNVNIIIMIREANGEYTNNYIWIWLAG